MDHAAVWTPYGPGGKSSPGHEDVLHLVRSATRAEPGGRVEALAVACARVVRR
ncbi:hypothetical protein ACFCV9_22535 [Streptomyces sp. NPDC056367]|uniref:hypothetical protein n=1 Tax=Streptomyces sp. NPDC056367 TaxID=3345797 RepID=UPI0035D68362